MTHLACVFKDPRRAALMAGLSVLDTTPEVAELAASMIERVPLPPRAGADAAHIAAAAYHPLWSGYAGRVGIPRLSFARRTNSWERTMTEAAEPREPWRDPIVAEVRRVREKLFAAAGYDIREFCRRLREEQAGSEHQVVTRAPREKHNTPGEAA